MFHLLNKGTFSHLESFDDALEVEEMYSNHRNSDSFRKHQKSTTSKRPRPENYVDKSDLIDVNDMVESIKNKNAGNSINTILRPSSMNWEVMTVEPKLHTRLRKV